MVVLPYSCSHAATSSSVTHPTPHTRAPYTRIHVAFTQALQGATYTATGDSWQQLHKSYVHHKFACHLIYQCNHNTPAHSPPSSHILSRSQKRWLTASMRHCMRMRIVCASVCVGEVWWIGVHTQQRHEHSLVPSGTITHQPHPSHHSHSLTNTLTSSEPPQRSLRQPK